MLCQVGFLVERLAALANVGFHSGMDGQMLEEAVPPIEQLAARRVRAAKDLIRPKFFPRKALEDYELVCLWDMLIDVNLVQVEVLSVFDHEHRFGAHWCVQVRPCVLPDPEVVLVLDLIRRHQLARSLLL